MAIAARCPFVAVDERIRFITQKEYEIDDLTCKDIEKQYIFSFSSTMLLSGTKADWKTSILDNVLVKLSNMEYKLSPAVEVDQMINFNLVRQHKLKRMGIRFIHKY
jgi:hypothetical protein